MEKILSKIEDTFVMGAKHHCIICGSLIFDSLYCADCQEEVSRARTMDEESLDEWLSRNRVTNKVPQKTPTENVRSILEFP